MSLCLFTVSFLPFVFLDVWIQLFRYFVVRRYFFLSIWYEFVSDVFRQFAFSCLFSCLLLSLHVLVRYVYSSFVLSLFSYFVRAVFPQCVISLFRFFRYVFLWFRQLCHYFVMYVFRPSVMYFCLYLCVSSLFISLFLEVFLSCVMHVFISVCLYFFVQVSCSYVAVLQLFLLLVPYVCRDFAMYVFLYVFVFMQFVLSLCMQFVVLCLSVFMFIVLFLQLCMQLCLSLGISYVLMAGFSLVRDVVRPVVIRSFFLYVFVQIVSS